MIDPIENDLIAHEWVVQTSTFSGGAVFRGDQAECARVASAAKRRGESVVDGPRLQDARERMTGAERMGARRSA